MAELNRKYRWGVIATACSGTEGLEVAFCPLCCQYQIYGRHESEMKYGRQVAFGWKVNRATALELAARCICPEFALCPTEDGGEQLRR